MPTPQCYTIEVTTPSEYDAAYIAFVASIEAQNKSFVWQGAVSINHKDNFVQTIYYFTVDNPPIPT